MWSFIYTTFAIKQTFNMLKNILSTNFNLVNYLYMFKLLSYLFLQINSSYIAVQMVLFSKINK